MPDFDICYIISYGFSERMILHTDLVKELKKAGLNRIAVILPVEEDNSFKELEQRLGIKAFFMDIKYNHWSQEFLTLRKYIYEDINNNPALLSKHLKAKLEYKGNNPWRKIKPNLYYSIHNMSRKFTLIQKLFGVYERFILRNRKLTRLIKKINPGILVSTYPVNFIEGAGVQIAKDLKITSLTQLSSWDNITCKGRFPALSEYFISWGKIMSDELEEYYDLSPDEVFETGVPHFDKSKELVNPGKLKTFIKELNLDPNRLYIFFGMSSPYFAPKEIDIVERLADQIERNIYGEDMQFIIRPHPQNILGEMADIDWLTRLNKLVSERVAVNYPSLGEKKLPWNVNEEDLEMLANLISGCSVLLNTGSTLSIEGLIHNRPVIATLFDADFNIKAHNSASRINKYFHFKKLIDNGGVLVVSHYEDLKNGILKFLANPDFNKEQRDKALFLECGNVDGKSSERIANAFVEILKRQKK